ncbi:hypothetical protein [Frateuria terrea]|uniref:WD40-like Beta Propeller Repeat n=1 Tax=Frateuria terrea TaxID=529704 RepID=A0A1H6Q8A3_9GAMM|nr:hypothetical protein [Frateuria terrea]SEI38086.1 hypothetical protein SAMN04487997_0327 [Frateuria terrea]SFP03639.1 hypothetical protein SAMN02927913_0242 [Frateuria terrea]
MKNQKLAGAACAILLVALSAPSAFAQNASSASILFTRTNMRPIDNTSNTVLYRVSPSGGTAVPMTPSTIHVDYRDGSWSPGGISLVYEKAPQATFGQTQLFVVDRQGGLARQITTGTGLHTQPSWGPGAAITFVTMRNGDACLGAVRADGANQRILFCPPQRTDLRTPGSMSTPQWTADGNHVLIEASAWGKGLESDWYSRVWKVNISTGAAEKITEQAFGGAQHLTIAPDGRHGFYPEARTLIDFQTGTRTTIPVEGQRALYSKDGTRIAFVQSVRGSDPTAGLAYGAIFIMGANGNNIHPAITVPDPDALYAIADWSKDSSKLLVIKLADLHKLQIVNLATGTATNVVENGVADKGAWYQP